MPIVRGLKMKFVTIIPFTFWLYALILIAVAMFGGLGAFVFCVLTLAIALTLG